ncbi:MAG: ThuA domain-containing protein [Bryobacteraceae bacterium]
MNLAPAQVMEKMFRSGAIRVLILSGRNNHDWRATTPRLRQILDATGRFDVHVTEEPAGLNEAALAPYHVLVSDYCGPRWGAASEQAVESFVRSGKGLVSLHAAAYSFGTPAVLGPYQTGTGIKEPPWPEYAKMLGGWWALDSPSTGHGFRHVFHVKWQDRRHPIAAGLDESFLIGDELYHALRTQPDIHVLATAYSDPETKGTGKEEPLLWTVSYAKGRTFYSALGHDLAAMNAPGYVASFTRGVEWAATGAVTLPPVIELDRINDDAVRISVITGGHGYDPSFATLFDAQPRIRATMNPHPRALPPDTIKKYDVLVFYDMNQSLPDDQKQMLVRFAESGKGIVVLHHAVANFNDWEWWWKDVVGARYLLKPIDGQPASTFKHDVPLVGKPVVKHPILKGIPPMYILDETYKGMWFSPDIQVLLKTDEATADGPLAWISGYRKSRVVVIQLGHSSDSHRHPQFRQLVWNSIEWAAGRGEAQPVRTTTR